MIIFYCPLGQKPNGGHKVIYQTVQSLNKIGIDSYIFHEIRDYKLKWLNDISKVKFTNKIPRSSHLVIPEVSLLKINKDVYENEYSILVQNGYFIFYECNSIESYKRLKKIYHNAKYIYCVSPDTQMCIMQQFSGIKKKIKNFIPDFNNSIFNIDKKDYSLKKNIITIIKRKNPNLSLSIVKYLKFRLPNNWKIQIIDNLNETELSKMLKISKIFINVPGLEGFCLPPIEASLSGNIVIGSTGNAAKLYWKFFRFKAVELGDVKQISKYVLSAIKKNKFNINTSRQNTLIKFLNSCPKLHSVIKKNHKNFFKKKKSNNEEIVIYAKSYLAFIFDIVIKKIKRLNINFIKNNIK